MIGVQSCKHFGCQRSQSTFLDFRHPSGALEDGARGHSLGILAIKSSLEMPFHTGTVLVLCFFILLQSKYRI